MFGGITKAYAMLKTRRDLWFFAENKSPGRVNHGGVWIAGRTYSPGDGGAVIKKAKREKAWFCRTIFYFLLFPIDLHSLMRQPLPLGKQIVYAFGMMGWSIMINLISVILVYLYAPPNNSGLPVL